MNLKSFHLVLILCLFLCCPIWAQSAQPFTLDNADTEKNLNDYWTIYGISEGQIGRNGALPPVSQQTNALERMAIKSAWTNHPIRRQLIDMLLDTPINGVNANGKQQRGYVWADKDHEDWQAIHTHYDQMPRYICAANLIWKWTGDAEFLQLILPRAETVMNYMINVMKGDSGIVSCLGKASGLSYIGKPSSFMDCYREGYRSAWINLGYYSALLCLADMERAFGNTSKALYYGSLAQLCHQKFDGVFWSDAHRRYIGWRDVKGNSHDYGFTYINLEALARGLGDVEKAYYIFDWLDNGKAQPTIKGAHIGSTDIYQLVVAPRTNTVRVADKDWDPWSLRERPILGKFYKYAYGAITRDGGTMLWFNYYDVMARLRWLDADSAWERLSAMLNRCAGDPKFLTFGPQGTIHFRAYNIYDEHFLEIGSADTYQSSGISAMSVLYGFMGVSPADHGLVVYPRLPSDIQKIGCRGIAYRGSTYDVTVSRLNTARPVRLSIMQSHPSCTVFQCKQTFSGIDLPDAEHTTDGLKLLRKMGKHWRCVADVKLKVGSSIIADQPAGIYKLEHSKELQSTVQGIAAFVSTYEVSCPQAEFSRQVQAGRNTLIEVGN